MARPRLTDAERADREAKRKASWKIENVGSPNPSGVKGDHNLWASIAESVVGKVRKLDFSLDNKILTLLDIFGFTVLPTLKELITARNKLLLVDGIHPDKGGSVEMTRKVLEAFEILKKQIA